MTKNSFIKILGLLLVVGLLFAALPSGSAQAQTGTTIQVGVLDPSWTAPGGGGVYAAYYGPSNGYVPVVPGSTASFDGREAGIIKAGINIDADGHYWDEGILAFKVNNVPTTTFATQALSYEVQNETGGNPVWVRIRIDGNTTFQHLPESYGVGGGYHVVNAAAGQWQLMDSNGNGTGPLMTLGELATAYPSALVDRVYLTLGMGDSYHVSDGVGTVGWVDKVIIDTVTYDFVVIPTTTCTTNCYVNSATGADTFPGTADFPFKTIQQGINAVSTSGTVHVADGTYNEENILISKGITLIGAGAATTSIAPTAVTNNSTIIVNNPSGNVTISGFNFVMQPKPNYGSAVVVTGTGIAVDSATVTISNNVVTGSGDGSKSDYGFYGQNNNAKVIIENNTINNTGDNPICFEGQAGSTTVRNNVFRIVASPDYDPYFSMAYAGLTVLTPQIVEGNTFYLDHAGTGYASAITFNTAVLNDWAGTTTDSGHYTNILIKDNVIYTDGPQARGVNLADRSAGGALGTITGAVITGNQIIGENLTDVNTYGVALKGDVQSAQIQSNIINNVDIGIRIIPGNGTAPICPSGSTISSNQITSVGVSVKNECTSGSVDVTHNWWGSAAGPTAGTMVGTVSYDPWCGDAACSFFVTQAQADALAAVNAAANATAMQTALENHPLVWNLTAYDTLETGRKPAVAADLLSNRPVGGFATVAAVQSMLDEIVGTRLVLQTSLDAVNAGTITGLSFLDPVITNLQSVHYTLMNGQPIADILPGLISTRGIFNSFTLATQGEILTALTSADYLSWSQMFGAFYNLVNGIKPELALDPASASTDVCAATNTLNVLVADAVDLQGYRIEITFDKTKIQILDVVNGGFLATTNLITGEKKLGNDTGRLILDLVTQSGVPGTALTFDGSGTLVTITYKALGGVGANTSSFILDAATSKLVRWTDDAVGPIYPAYDVTVGTANVSAGGLLVRNTTVEPDADYCSLTTAVAAATSGDTLQVLADITTTDSITIDKALTLDTNGKTINRTGVLVGSNFFVVGPAGNLTITGGGTISTTYGNAIRIAGDETTQATLTLESGTLYGPNASVAIIGNRSYTQTPAFKSLFEMTGGNTNETVLVLGNGAEANITGGTLTGAAPIMGNGTVSAALDKNEGGTKITIGGTAKVGSPTLGWVAIFHPQVGELTINGGTIQGYNGIEMAAGDLVVTGGTIEGYGTCVATPVWTAADGSTNTGDAILILRQDGYGVGDTMNVTISGDPTITSTSCYALREFDLGGNTSEVALATITGGHFTGGTAAVFFDTVDPAILKLTDGSYNTDPGATPDYVYTPYDTYVSGPWFMIDPVDITATTLAGPYVAGAPSTVTITVADTDHTGPFEVVFTYPEGTVISYGGDDYVCTDTSCPVIPVTLSDPGPTTLSFAVTLPGVGPYDVGVALNHKAGTTDIRLLDSETQTGVTAAGAYVVTGSFSLQARYQGVKLGIPVNFKWNGTVFVYGPTAQTDANGAFSQTLTFGGSYTVITSQERYLNVEGKTMALSANKSLPTLMLKGGNAYWKSSLTELDNVINGSDASLVGSQYGTAGSYTIIGNHGDCNFDGIVNIQDLALVGGNWYLTSAAAYASWLP